ncbi:hypothetical protein [Dyella sp. Tek66A03]|uniref:hypothetical protein n=1 Tax=Dyella sp. Tek66A03 TaxID=3458298 RepID=UPI00403E914E
MAVHDHTVPARQSFLALGDPFTDSPAAGLSAHRPQAPSPRGTIFDDVALAHYALSRLWFEDELYRKAKAKHPNAQPLTWPLPTLFKDGVAVAIQCLEQYAKQLSNNRPMNG